MQRLKRFSLILGTLLFGTCMLQAQQQKKAVEIQLSFPQPSQHRFHVDIRFPQSNRDSLVLKMPQWSPGYYQIMEYGKMVENVQTASSTPFRKVNDHTWIVYNPKHQGLTISYDVRTDRKFVAKSWVDSSHAYIVPTSAFMYVEEELQWPVHVKITSQSSWTQIATGLENGMTKNEFQAPNFDILYDCPILLGPLESLPTFKVQGIPHRFIGYQLTNFDKLGFMKDLEKIVGAAVSIMEDIPYKQYSFIGIGPGMGGIEHLNNTTISFDGQGMNTVSGKIRTYNFLAHEYFHHYNVKRIRPIELGPFNYETGSRSNLLWISEGLTVYYEYLILKKAGLTTEEQLLSNLSNNITAFENGPGKLNQSLAQASYETWSDGPFGRQGAEASKSISYYDKGPIVGMIFDLEIRHATDNKHSLNDVMRSLYQQFYIKKKRGFSDAEFQETCERIAGRSLSHLFDYVYTTKKIDYDAYLAYAGLHLTSEPLNSGKVRYKIEKMESGGVQENRIFKNWMAEE